MKRGLAERFDVVTSVIENGGRQFTMFRPRSADDLISEEDFDRDERLPYWADFWPSSIALAERLAREDGRGRRLLELGCGAGLVATVAAAAGFEVTATDYYAEALEFAELNAEHNGCALHDKRVVDWRDMPDDLGRFEVVVASDVLYEKPYSDLVASAFAATLAPGGLGILTDPQRQHGALFPVVCARHNLQIHYQADVAVSSGAPGQKIDLYEFTLATDELRKTTS
jgi:predicted nicotinamide N-methyase